MLSQRMVIELKRTFNTEGQCDPQLHYMVNLEPRLAQIKRLVDGEKYFVINRARQYGKTTTLIALEDYLKDEYNVIFLDFQKMSDAEFRDEGTFSVAFADMFLKICSLDHGIWPEDVLRPLGNAAECGELQSLRRLFVYLSDLCSKAQRPVVLMIDEVDSATNNQVFLDFLAQLRAYYIDRKKVSTFHSVILAGVYDIKNLKLKLRSHSEHRFNSPWNTRGGNESNESLLTFDDCPRDYRGDSPYNIAAKFRVDMSFSVDEIAMMLRDYENDHSTGMEIGMVSQCIYDYTSGYPYLVSAICKILDEELMEDARFACGTSVWSPAGISEAVKIILKEPATLFESMIKQIDMYEELSKMLNAILFQGDRLTYNPDNEAISLGAMFGFIKDIDNNVAVANRIFEMRLYHFFLSKEELTNTLYREAQNSKFLFIRDGRLDMELVLERFVIHFTDIYGDNDQRFIEKYGRKFFLLYLKPIINGTGNYYVEAQTSDARRTDVIVDYRGEQFILELKIWNGEKYSEAGEAQLAGYLESYHLEKGYLITFSFNKNKKIGVRKVNYGDKVIVEATV